MVSRLTLERPLFLLQSSLVAMRCWTQNCSSCCAHTVSTAMANNVTQQQQRLNRSQRLHMQHRLTRKQPAHRKRMLNAVKKQQQQQHRRHRRMRCLISLP